MAFCCVHGCTCHHQSNMPRVWYKLSKSKPTSHIVIMATFLSAFWMVRTVHACTEQIHGMITDRNKQLNSQTAWSLIEKYCCYSSWNDWVEVTTKITSLLSNCLIKYEGMHGMWYHHCILNVSLFAETQTCTIRVAPYLSSNLAPIPKFPRAQNASYILLIIPHSTNPTCPPSF